MAEFDTIIKQGSRLSKTGRATVEPLLRRRWRALASKAAVRKFDLGQA